MEDLAPLFCQDDSLLNWVTNRTAASTKCKAFNNMLQRTATRLDEGLEISDKTQRNTEKRFLKVYCACTKLSPRDAPALAPFLDMS